MKTLKLIEQNWVIGIASYWEPTEVTDEEFSKITWDKYITKREDWNFIFEINPAFIELEKEQQIEEINQEFQDKISSFTKWYSQQEIDTWKQKVEEAKIVLAWWTSELLEWLLIEWENVINFATIILTKAQAYSKIYIDAERVKREKIKALNI